MNRYTACIVLAIALLISANPVSAQQQRTSPHESIYARVGGKLVSVTYGRPYSKDPKSGEIRKIWGTLVPWDKAWRMGSDEATTMILQAPITIGNLDVPAGAYTLYFVPSESGTSKLAISKTIGGWGIPVNEKDDLGRVDVKKETVDIKVDQFTMALSPTALSWTWENMKYSVDLKAKQ